MRFPPTTLCVLFLSSLAFGHADAQVTQEQISKAISNGSRILKVHQTQDGSWNYGGHKVGGTALAGLALLESGVAPDDPVITKAQTYLRNRAPYELQTYDLALAILFFSRMGDRDDKELILDLGSRLVAGQLPSGTWSYNCPKQFTRPTNKSRLSNDPKAGGSSRSSKKRTIRISRRSRSGDNSNTQFGVLGVYTAGLEGLAVDDSMSMVDQWFRSTQSRAGGWDYRGGRSDTESMTCAGLMALLLAKAHQTTTGADAKLANNKDGDIAKALNPKEMASDRVIDKGIVRTEFYAGRMRAGSSLYFIWSVERVAVALGATRIGQVDWYMIGSNVLVQTQQADGAWTRGYGPVADTSFALLFLNRSNLAKGVPKLLTNQNLGSSNRLRPSSLLELKKSVRSVEKKKDD